MLNLLNLYHFERFMEPGTSRSIYKKVHGLFLVPELIQTSLRSEHTLIDLIRVKCRFQQFYSHITTAISPTEKAFSHYQNIHV